MGPLFTVLLILLLHGSTSLQTLGPRAAKIRLSLSKIASPSSTPPFPEKPPPLKPDSVNEQLLGLYAAAFGYLPVASLVLIPTVLSQITNFDLPVVQRQLYIVTLLLSKRLLLYGLAYVSVEIASYRSLFAASEGLGQRLMIVNDEIFAGMGTLGEGNRQRRILELKEEIKTLKYNTTNSRRRWN